MLNSMIIRFTQSTEGGAILIPDASAQGLFLRPLDTERARVKDGFQFCLVLDGDDSPSSSILHCNLWSKSPSILLTHLCQYCSCSD